MRKILTLILAAAICGLSSCTDDDLTIQVSSATSSASNGGISFAVDTEIPDASMSKTYISGSSVLFTGTEHVAIYSDISDSKNDFTTSLIEEKAGKSVNISGSIETEGVSKYYAAMPLSASNSFSTTDKKFNVTVPSTQYAQVAGSCDPAAQVMVAACDKSSMSFHFLNVCSYFKFTLNNPVAQVVLKTTGEEGIAGTVTVDDKAAIDQKISCTNTITMLPKAGDNLIPAGTYYFAILPCSMSEGFSIEITCKDGNVITKTNSNSLTFSRASSKNYGKITIPNYFYIKTKGTVRINLNIDTCTTIPNLQYAIDSYNDSDFHDLPMEQNDKDQSSGHSVTGEHTVYLRGNNPTGFSHGSSDFAIIKMDRASGEGSNHFTVGGNLMSIFDNCGTEATEIPCDYCFYKLFEDGVELANTPELPSPTLKEYCYGKMFSGCTYISSATELPAETLAKGCYSNMFDGCTALVTAPTIGAKSMADYSCFYMFKKCTSLKTAPAINATTVGSYSCAGMFHSCSAMTKGPSNLPATALAEDCYRDMFNSCTKLTAAPNISATSTAPYCCYCMFYNCTGMTQGPSALNSANLAEYCYYQMFYGCEKLQTCPTIAATSVAQYCCYDMFRGCTVMTLPSGFILNPTTLAPHCYRGMFYLCKGLVNPPTVKATELAEYCCQDMFTECTSLTSSPELFAKNLVTGCYKEMFEGCTALQVIKVHFTAWTRDGETDCTTDWTKDLYKWAKDYPTGYYFYGPESIKSYNYTILATHYVNYGDDKVPQYWTFYDINTGNSLN